MDAVELRAWMGSATARFRTIHMRTRHVLDTDAYRAGLARFRSNPWVRELIDDTDWSRWSGTRESWYEAWWRKPADYRFEHAFHGGGIESISGGDGRTTWQFTPDDDRLRVDEDRSEAVTAFGEPADVAEFEPGTYDKSVGTMFWPQIGELIDPSELLFSIKELRVTGEGEVLGRRVHRAETTLDWSTLDALYAENLPPADDHELLVDAQIGVLLRIASRFDGEEFSVAEVTHVAFDEPLEGDLFRPPKRPTR
ncbi:MAG: hypothetical protein ACRDJP_08185 [Actinomycetota bacterium]